MLQKAEQMTRTSSDGHYRNQIDYVIGSRRWKSCIFSFKTRPGSDCCTDHKLFISNTRVKLKKSTKRILVPNCNVNNVPDGFKVHIKKQIYIVQLNRLRTEETWTETKNIIREECEKTMPEIKRKEKSRWMIEKKKKH